MDAATTQSLASAKQPPSLLSEAASESEIHFLSKVEPLVGTEVSFLTMNS